MAHSKRITVSVLAAILLVAGCADTAYLVGSATGHLKILQAARPVDDWLADEQTPAALKQRLQLAQEIRRFAVDQLHLPDNASYQRYVQLQRRAVVWNVVAAPPYSLTLKTWCFPVAGCVGYRGYFDEQDAKQEADALRAQGLEASVYGVPAYSTLGWMNWLGGDPLLSTFIQYPQGELARMIFHELAHQVVYVKDDTAFNESFATAVERLGGAAWLAHQANPAVQAEYASLDARRRAFRALTAQTRMRLRALYADNKPSDGAAQEAMKQVAYAEFRQAYAQLKQGWGGQGPYDVWVANANNAAFGALAAYDDWVAAFETLYARQPGDWRAFYAAVQQLAALPRDQRTQQLQQLLGEKSSSP
ncbi:aminopeptidase [Rhodoferax sp. AJA081-3]|uniref:aminopeptidase n=1 Tax=Rhodoferax sp. AJA081-3 TaxID=2752316 RepID=UPI001ADF1354|nr:aminopeptidase [Rhodoferax sp. AJA081-3]QTN27573.1 aminopeptidase [Rhodoferax sp. AJA081-3]